MENLEDLENKALGKLIGLLNGMDEFLPDENLKNKVNDILLCLKSNSNLQNCIDELVTLKKKFLPNCLTCLSPCGRTNDFSLNDISNPQIKEDRIKEYREYISSYNGYSDFNDVIYHITKLSW